MGSLFIPSNISEASAFERTTHLAIVAHQDDIEIMAYNGIMECFRDDSKWFSGVIVTNGVGSPRTGCYSELSDSDFIKIRNSEQKKAAIIGEYNFISFFDYESSALLDKSSREEVILELEQIILSSRPDIIYCHNIFDSHLTHVAIATCTIQALRNIKDVYIPKELYGCEVWRSLDWLCGDSKMILNASNFENLAHSLVGVFDSQIHNNKRYDLATIGRRHANATFNKSDAKDRQTSSTLAVNLLPLIENPQMSIKLFALSLIDELKDDVLSKIEQFEFDTK